MLFFLTLLGWLIALFWLIHASVVVHFLYYHRLKTIADSIPELPHYPKLSIIVPARDEQQKIAQALNSLLALDYPNFEVIAINDRSNDETGHIMEQLKLNSDKLKVLHIKSLPANWLGKTHAMHLAAKQATGEYLLFTDGDVIYKSDALKHIMRVATHQKWQHLSLMPQLLTGDYWENSVTQFMALLFIMFLYPFRIANNKAKNYAGVGPFNLITRDCYYKIGGFAALSLEVVEDMELGRAVKQHGFSSQLLIAEDLVQFRWQEKVSGLIKGIEKNSFAALDYSVFKLILLTLVLLLIVIMPYWAVYSLAFSHALGYVIALLVLHGVLAIVGIRAKVGWSISLALLFSFAVTLFAVWRSALLALIQGGIYWRDTFYSLPVLKDAMTMRYKVYKRH
ncbi:MAG: glycosyltransferase [Methylococcaceae bacterium]